MAAVGGPCAVWPFPPDEPSAGGLFRAFPARFFGLEGADFDPALRRLGIGYSGRVERCRKLADGSCLVKAWLGLFV